MARPNKNTSARYQGNLTEREIQCMNLYLAGHTYEQVAKEVGYTDRRTAHDTVKRALRKRAAERDDIADLALTTMLDQLQGIIRGHYAKALAGDHRSAQVVLNTFDRQAKLLGLDQPIRVEATTYVVDDITREIAELSKSILDDARAKGENVDAPILEAVIAHALPAPDTDTDTTP